MGKANCHLTCVRFTCKSARKIVSENISYTNAGMNTWKAANVLAMNDMVAEQVILLAHV